MTEFIQGTAIVTVYRAITIGCGLLVVFFGYRLFRVGLFEKAGELEAAWGKSRLILKQAAPGSFFALFGAAIIGLSVWRGLEFETVRASPQKVAPKANVKDMPPSLAKSTGDALPLRIAPAQSPAVKAALAKAAKGQLLGKEEQKIVQEWLEKQEGETIHYRAYVPKEEQDRSGGPALVPG